MKRVKASVRTVQTQLSFTNHSGNTPEFQLEQTELSKTPENCRKYLRSGMEHAKRVVVVVLLRVFERSTDVMNSIWSAKFSWEPGGHRCRRVSRYADAFCFFL